MRLVVCSVLRGCESTSLPPGPAPAASLVSGGCAAHDLACRFPTATSSGVELKVGRGVRQCGVARDWQALRLLDKPTRAVPSSFLSVFDPQPKSAPARSQNSNRNSWHWQATGGAQGYRGSVAGHEEVQEAHPGGFAPLLAPLGPQDQV